MQREQNVCLLPQADNQTLMATLDTYTDLAVALLTHYSFDLGGYDPQEIVNQWQRHYPVNWLHLAVIEALYQGRYKAFSVQQILSMWHRRQHATYHFNMEFERLICSKFPVNLTETQPLTLPGTSSSYTTKNQRSHSQQQMHLLNGSGYDSTTNPEIYNHDSHRLSPEDRKQPYQNLPVDIPSPERVENGQLATKLTYQTVNPPIPHFQPQQSQPITRGNITQRNDFRDNFSEKLTAQIEKSSSTTNHPPIGQFTPTEDNSSLTFTSKLHAMVATE